MVWEYIKFNKKKIKLGNQIYLEQKETLESVQQTIEVVFATDNNYVRHCGAAIASILLNSDNTSQFKFYILDGGIKPENKIKLENLKKIRTFEIIYYDMTKYDFSMFPMNRKYISSATYYRLLLTDLLPKNTKQVIYLDCDIIVERDLKELWNIDISSYFAGVVEDEGSIEQQQRLHLPKKNNYFNAGVLFLNIDMLRAFDIKKKYIEYFNEKEDIITLQDQDILNGVFNGRCVFLPLCWNTNGRIYNGNSLRKNYKLNEAKIAGYNPSIIHYTDKIKPWNYKCNHPLMSEYWKYLNYTDFKSGMTMFNFLYNLKQILNTIFSINTYGVWYKVNILGLKIKIKSKKLVKYAIINDFYSRISDIEDILYEMKEKQFLNYTKGN